MSKSPSYVSKNVTYIGRNFLPTPGGSKSIPKRKQYYLLSDVQYGINGKASKIKTVYQKDALVKSIIQANKRGYEGARSMTGKTFYFQDVIPIGVSPNRIRKLFAKLGDMGSAMKGLSLEKVMQRRAFVNKGRSIYYKMSPGEREKFPKHWGTHKWHLNNYETLWDMIAAGKIKTVQQLDDIDRALQVMEYGGKNPKKLIYKVLNGTVKSEQVIYLNNVRTWIYGKKNIGPQKDKINRFLENKVLKGELTKEVTTKISQGPENLTKFVSYIKSLFHKK
jgi:hypothetical protein